jgi:integrase
MDPPPSLPEEHPWLRSIIAADISKVSIEQYIRNAIKLQKLAKGRSFEEILSHPKAMFKRIEAEYPNLQSRKAMVSAIKAIVKYNPSLRDTYPDHIEKWSAWFRDVDREITARVATAEPTERELVNWVEWKEVLRKQYELGVSEYASIPHLLVSMYSLIEPIRADYGNVRIIQDGIETPPVDANYISLSRYSEQSKLVLHSYKTSRKYGSFQRILPDQLVNIILTSLSREPRHYLFTDDRGRPYEKKNSFTRFANRTFERIFGKKFTISLMRHSFVSNLDFNESTPAKLFQHSKNMMHSIGTQQLYRRKIVPTLNIQQVQNSDRVYIV